MLIAARFLSRLTAATGLNPTVSMYDLADGSPVVEGAVMTHMADGLYAYECPGCDADADYGCLCDGGPSLPGPERYAIGARLSTKSLVIAWFGERCAPSMSLSPVASIYDMTDGVTVVSGAPMAHVGGGFYAYRHSSQVDDHDYVVVCDGGSALPPLERYAFGPANMLLELRAGPSITLVDGLVHALQVERVESMIDETRLLHTIAKQALVHVVSEGAQAHVAHEQLVHHLEGT